MYRTYFPALQVSHNRRVFFHFYFSCFTSTHVDQCVDVHLKKQQLLWYLKGNKTIKATTASRAQKCISTAAKRPHAGGMQCVCPDKNTRADQLSRNQVLFLFPLLTYKCSSLVRPRQLFWELADTR